MVETDIKVILVDDEILAINRLKVLLNHFSEVEIIGEISNSTKACDIILENEPDIIFLDVEMPNKTGLEVAEELQKNLVFSKIIFVTSYDHYAVDAIKKNAFDYILKPVSIKSLKEAIERYKSKMYLNLTKRELTILRGIAKGESSKEIAEQLHISRHTVDTHRRTILEKTSCKNAVELVAYASKHNLI